MQTCIFSAESNYGGFVIGNIVYNLRHKWYKWRHIYVINCTACSVRLQ